MTECLQADDLQTILDRLSAVELRLDALSPPPPPSPSPDRIITVGPGGKYPTPGAVPLGEIVPGTVVQIAYRPEPYRDKFVIASRGTSDKWIAFRGQQTTGGARPVIDGTNATTNAQFRQDYRPLEDLGLIAINRLGSQPTDFTPGFIDISGLEIRGATADRTDPSYTAYDGSKRSYLPDACGLYLVKFESVRIRNCLIADNANGLFASGNQRNTDLEVRDNEFVGNGRVGSDRCHSSYCEVGGTTYLNNVYRRHRAGSGGGHLKDRGAVPLITGNRFEGASRQVDLGTAESSASWMRQRTDYVATTVRNNLFLLGPGDGIQAMFVEGRTDAAGNGQVVTFEQNTLACIRDYSSQWPAVIVANNWEQTATDGSQTGYTPPAVLKIANSIFYVAAATPGLYSNDFCFFKAGNRVEVTGPTIVPGWWVPSYLRNTHSDIVGVEKLIALGADGKMPDPGFANPAAGQWWTKADSPYRELGIAPSGI